MKPALSIGLCVCLVGCTTARPPAPLPARDATLPRMRLAQHGYGDDARFAYCLPASCPVATPKALAVSPFGHGGDTGNAGPDTRLPIDFGAPNSVPR